MGHRYTACESAVRGIVTKTKSWRKVVDELWSDDGQRGDKKWSNNVISPLQLRTFRTHAGRPGSDAAHSRVAAHAQFCTIRPNRG